MRKSRKKLYFGVIFLFFVLAFSLLIGAPSTDNEMGFITDRKEEDKPKREKQLEVKKVTLINPSGETIEERFMPPVGFDRVDVASGSFSEWLRKYPLKADGSKIHYYNGEEKQSENHAAVLNLDVGKKDLQQCADSIIRLRAEYFYQKKAYDKISFHFTNGFPASYEMWQKGYGVAFKGNRTVWVRSNRSNESRESFRRFLDIVYSYSGTLSLEKELKQKKLSEMKIGDVFIRGGSPGHCLIVMDMAKDKETGETVFMVAQGFMPAQEMHIMKNTEEPQISPWYRLRTGVDYDFVETTFHENQLRSFE